MKLIEIHILQTFPVSCLNRDDLNSPKTAVFGGMQRARVSSQCWKRAIREHAAENCEMLKGRRTRLIIAELQKRVPDEARREALVACFAHHLARLDPENEGKVKTLTFFSPGEYDRIASAINDLDEEDKVKLTDAFGRADKSALAENDDDADEDSETEPSQKRAKAEKKPLTAKQFTKLVTGIAKPAIKAKFKKEPLPKDAADIALFGRMVANDPSLNIEGAAMFGHALSTHKVDNEIDFFAAVDDLQSADESGAGMTGTLEFNSATYYRYAALNLTMLEDEAHLAALSRDERREVVRAFIEATLKAVPSARNNSMNAATLPGCVLGIVRERGQPLQLVNAFEKPVRLQRDKSIGETSAELLRAENERMKTTWGIVNTEEVWMPETNLAALLDQLTADV